MLINTWYVVADSTDLDSTSPMKVTLLGQTLALFRNEQGVAQCVSDVCIHRGGSLAGGKVKNGCIECPYHGWLYNDEGQCTLIPAAGKDKPVPQKARVDRYPVQEKFGWIWVFV